MSTPSPPVPPVPPVPSVGFPELGVPRPLTAVLEQRGITTPFPIQAATLPDCLAGRDVCGKAPTGSGKTLAFGLAVLTRVSAGPRTERRGHRHPSALVLVPTRELAAQIEDVIAPLAGAVGLRVASIYGGVAYGGQLAALRRGVDVLVACPGRLTDLVESGSVDLSHVRILVIDEADRMADMGFLPVVRRLIDRTDASRQTHLFSATLDGAVAKLIRDYQHDPIRHNVDQTDTGQGAVSHHFWQVDPHERISVTAEAVTARGPAVVFCRTKRGADRLSDRLAHSGLAAAAIHGNRSQSQRERALAAFRAGRLDVLVATDIAARGIHIDAVPLVVHFDPPADTTDYVHRSGRTGRAGAKGVVVSLIGREHLGLAREIQKRLGFERGLSRPDVRSLPQSPRNRPTLPRAPRPRSTSDGGANPAHAERTTLDRRPRRKRASRRGRPTTSRH